MKTDEYGEVLNDLTTFEEIARQVQKLPVLIGWTDNLGSHFDILFSFGISKTGPIQGGISPLDLFVSIMRVGAFGFEISHKDTSPGYYAEKLGIGGSTGEKLAELINGVKKELNR